MTKNAQEVADRIAAALREGTVPWHQPWIGGTQVARNLKTKRAYTGLNVLLLAISPHAGRYFVTYKQALALKGQVRKGEHGTRIFFWMTLCTRHKRDVRDCGCPRKGEHVRLLQKGFTVFNAETQCDGLKVPAPPVIVRDNEGALGVGLTLVEKLSDGPACLEADDGAWYRPATDELNLPPTERFPQGLRYYTTALHELVHATAHKDRLDREVKLSDQKSYAREELVAEVGACIAARELGFEPALDQSADYIKGWLTALDSDPQLVTVAAGKAAKAVEYLIGDHA